MNQAKEARRRMSIPSWEVAEDWYLEMLDCFDSPACGECGETLGECSEAWDCKPYSAWCRQPWKDYIPHPKCIDVIYSTD